MRQLFTLLIAVLTFCSLHAQKYVHYFMNDGTFNGFYTSKMVDVNHDYHDQNSIITINGNKHIVPFKNIEKIIIEDAYVDDNFDDDYRIYDGSFENEFFKRIIVDTRASLFASKNGDFGANDTILFSSVYNNEKLLFITNDRGQIKNVFNGQSLFYYVYKDGGLENVLELTHDDIFEHPLTLTPVSQSKYAKQSLSRVSPEVTSFFTDLIPSGINLAGGELAHNISEVYNNPENHNQMLLVDGLSITGDIAGIAGAFLAGIPTGGLTWAGIGIGVGLLGKDLIGLMNDLFPDLEQMEKFKEFYKNKYNITLKTINPENIKSDKADLRGTFTALNGIQGNIYFSLCKIEDFDNTIRIEGTPEAITSNSFVIKGHADNLDLDTDYFYTIWYECEIDGLHFNYIGENGTEFTTLTPSATTIGVESVTDRTATIKCAYSNVPEGASCGILYGYDGDGRSRTIGNIEGETSINLSGLEPNTEYSYRAFVKYNEKYYYGERKSFTTDPEEIPDLSGKWTFNQSFLGSSTVYPELVLSSSNRTSATYTASGFYGVISFSMTVSSDRSASIVLSSPYGTKGYFSGKFNEEFTSISGDSYIYDFGPNNWAVPPAEYEEPWSLTR